MNKEWYRLLPQMYFKWSKIQCSNGEATEVSSNDVFKYGSVAVTACK